MSLEEGDLRTLSLRVDKLEQGARAWRKYCLLLLALLAGMSTMGQAGGSEDTEELRAHSLVLVDPASHSEIRMGVDSDGAYLKMYTDSSGKAGVTLLAGPSGSSLVLQGPSTQVGSVELCDRTDERGVGLFLREPDGAVRAAVKMDGNNPSILVYDQHHNVVWGHEMVGDRHRFSGRLIR